jgi:hypothetical protein
VLSARDDANALNGGGSGGERRNDAERQQPATAKQHKNESRTAAAHFVN